jgi:hypothetical protein
MEYARLCEDESIKAVVHRWDTLSRYDQRRVSLEELCEAVGIRPGKLLGSVVEAAYDFNLDVGNLVAAVAHPRIVQTSIDRALTPDGVEDRRMHFQHTGYLPPPKGTVINNRVIAAAQSVSNGLPSFTELIKAVDRAILEANEQADSESKTDPELDTQKNRG